MAKIDHEPIQTVLKAFNKLYPNDRTPVVFIDSRIQENKKLFFNKSKILSFLFGIPLINRLTFINCGYSHKRVSWAGYDSKNCKIFIDGNTTIVRTVEVLIHEFAHAITYKDNQKDEHGKAWKHVCGLIFKEFMSAAKVEINRDKLK